MNTKIELAKDYCGTRYTLKDVREQLTSVNTTDLLNMFSSKPRGFAYITVSKEAQSLIPEDMYDDGANSITIGKICSLWSLEKPFSDIEGETAGLPPISVIENEINTRVNLFSWLTVYELNDSIMMSIESAAGIVGRISVIDGELTLTINYINPQLGIKFDPTTNYPSFELASLLGMNDEDK